MPATAIVIIAAIAQANGTQPMCSSTAMERDSPETVMTRKTPERVRFGLGLGFGGATGLLSVCVPAIKRGPARSGGRDRRIWPPRMPAGRVARWRTTPQQLSCRTSRPCPGVHAVPRLSVDGSDRGGAFRVKTERELNSVHVHPEAG